MVAGVCMNVMVGLIDGVAADMVVEQAVELEDLVVSCCCFRLFTGGGCSDFGH